MITEETRAITKVDLERGVTEDSLRERSQLPPPEGVIIKLKSQQTEIEVHLPGQIEENLSGPSIRNALPIKNRKVILPSNVNSNNSSEKGEAIERKKIYEKCMKLFRFVGLLLGIRMTYNWKPQRHFLFCIMCFTEAFGAFSLFFSVYVHYINGSYIRILEPLAISGLIVSCALKQYAFLRHWKQILSLIFAIRKYFRPNVIGRQAEIVKSTLRKTWTFLCILTIGIAAAVTFYAFTPIMVYMKTKELIPLLSVEIVFCDQTQTSGFIVATIMHFIFGSYAALLTVIYGAAMIFCFRSYIMFADLVAEDFQELDEMWNGINNISVEYKRSFLRNICKKRQDMNNYLDIVKYAIETKLFIYFCCSYFSQIICLYDITQNDWIGGYGPFLGIFLEMMFYCYMGTQVSIVDDKLCYSIYNSNWCMYDLESKRMVGILLHEAQQSKDLQLGTIGPLNLVTGITIVKSIYSYYTVMTELF